MFEKFWTTVCTSQFFCDKTFYFIKMFTCHLKMYRLGQMCIVFMDNATSIQTHTDQSVVISVAAVPADILSYAWRTEWRLLKTGTAGSAEEEFLWDGKLSKSPVAPYFSSHHAHMSRCTTRVWISAPSKIKLVIGFTEELFIISLPDKEPVYLIICIL